MNHYTNSQNGSAAHLSTPPATATNLCNKVPGIWFMKVGGDSPTDVDFSIAPEFAAAWGIPFPVPFSTAWEEEPKLKTIILSLPTRVLDALPTTAEILATTVADLQPRWPTALVVDFNIGRPDGVTWAPDAASPFGPLDLTNYIRSGINTVRFRQRPGQQATMTDYTFILYALPRELLPNRGSTSQHTGPSWKHRPSNPVAAQHLYPPIEMLHPAAQHPYPFHQYVSRPAPTEHPSLSQLAAPPSQAWNQRTPYPTVLPQNGSPQEHWNHPAVVHDPGARPNPVSLPGLGRPDFTNGLALGVTHEPFLIQVLTDRLSDRRTHRQALDRLHGVAGYSAATWKDYYLHHKDRLDPVRAQPPARTYSATLPSPVSTSGLGPNLVSKTMFEESGPKIISTSPLLRPSIDPRRPRNCLVDPHKGKMSDQELKRICD